MAVSVLYTNEIISILRLIRSENVGVKTFFSLMKMFGSANNALTKVGELSVRGGRSKPIKICTQEEAVREIEKLNKFGARIITYYDDAYSKLLRNISDPPPLISCLGHVNLLNTNSVSIVGARNASINGIHLATKFSRELARAGWTVVSGLARGIDSAAHQGALPHTIGVLAGGIDHIYPPENANLYREMAETGLLVAELPYGISPLSHHFPQRNRIISGLSQGVVIVEAGPQSGSLTTARLAAEQGREVFAVPGFPSDPRSRGTNKLLKEGAHLIESVDDILSNLRIEDATVAMEQEEKLISYHEYVELNDEYRSLIKDMLSAYPTSIETIAHHTNLPLPIVYTVIVELELAGKIARYHGNKVSLVYNENINHS